MQICFHYDSLFIADIVPCNPFELCSYDTASLASNTYLGNLHVAQELVWYISTSALQYITLTLDHFDVSCNAGTIFQVESTTSGTRIYCNIDKPLGEIVSLGNEMTVKFSTNILPGILLEHFAGHYSVKGMIHSSNSVHASTDTGKNKQIKRIYVSRLNCLVTKIYLIIMYIQITCIYFVSQCQTLI